MPLHTHYADMVSPSDFMRHPGENDYEGEDELSPAEGSCTVLGLSDFIKLFGPSVRPSSALTWPD